MSSLAALWPFSRSIWWCANWRASSHWICIPRRPNSTKITAVLHSGVLWWNSNGENLSPPPSSSVSCAISSSTNSQAGHFALVCSLWPAEHIYQLSDWDCHSECTSLCDLPHCAREKFHCSTSEVIQSCLFT
jgi:hypothetical protein